MVARVVEKLALRLAERQQGTITAPHLMPYVPLSLQLITMGLDALVDGSAIAAIRRDQIAGYEFAAYRDTPPQPGTLRVTACVVCGATLARDLQGVLCDPCAEALQQELGRLATPADWLAQAAHEHDILYNAAQHTGPVTATALASRSRATLRQMQHYLAQMSLEGYTRQDIDLTTGLLTYALPTVAYPPALYRHNLTTLQVLRSARKPLARLRDWRFLVPLAALACAMAVLALTTLLPPLWQRLTSHRPAAEHPAVVTERAPMSRPHDATAIHVSLRRNGFAPVGMTVSATQAPPFLLTERRPEGITTEPPYQGKQQKYGLLRLGSGAHHVYHLVLDLLPGKSPLMYIDRNQNGNLADDGAPLANQGSGFFATTLRLPLARLLPQASFPGDYEAWVFTNTRLWHNDLMTYYSRTQLKGTVRLAGRTYTAYVADRGTNDADFTNDGIYIDLDGNGKIEAASEFFPPGSSVRIGNQAYVLEITW
jgi:hypothetical protein